MLKNLPAMETSIEAGTFLKVRTTSNAFMLQNIHKRWGDTINHLLKTVSLREGVGGNSAAAAKIFLTSLCKEQDKTCMTSLPWSVIDLMRAWLQQEKLWHPTGTTDVMNSAWVISVWIINKLILELRFPLSHPRTPEQWKKILRISLQGDSVFRLWHCSLRVEYSSS